MSLSEHKLYEIQKGPKDRPYLESVGAVFEQNRKERLRKISELHVREEVVKAHSKYLQRNVVTSAEFHAAQFSVKAWAARNSICTNGKTLPGSKKCKQKRMLCGQQLMKHDSMVSQVHLASNSSIASPHNHHQRCDISTISITSNSNAVSPNNYLKCDSISKSVPKPDQASKKQKSSNQRLPRISANQNIDGCPFSHSNQHHQHSSTTSVDSTQALPLTENDFICAKASNGEPTIDLLSSDEDIANDIDFAIMHELSTSVQSRGGDQYCCTVVNCWAVFSTSKHLDDHLSGFHHSPCNPTTTLLDGHLAQPPSLYMCPQCADLYRCRLECQEHMAVNNHLPALMALEVVAFACSQCLAFFPDQITCHAHTSRLQHNQPILPFKDDFHNETGAVPVPRSFAEDLLKRCAAVPYGMRCVDCNTDFSSSTQWKHHLDEFSDSHVCIANASSTMADVTYGFLCDKECSTCSQILYASPGVEGQHCCEEHLTGTAVNLQVSSFAEFVRRCSISSPCVSQYEL